MEIITVENVTKQYDKSSVVSSIKFNVEKGKIYGFVGPNGAGKTTTIKLILGMIKPTEGSISILGDDISVNRERILKHIGALVEKPAFYGELNAYDNMHIVALMKGASVGSITELLKIMGLENTANKKVKKFSLGMKQRLGIAMALLGDPQIVILDEPINGLDPIGIHEMRKLILSLKNERSMTVLVSSHILSELEMIADELIIINAGQIIYCGSLDAFRKEFESDSLENAYIKIISASGGEHQWQQNG